MDLPAATLRGVQDAARRMARTLDEVDVAAELGRQAARLSGADLVAVMRVSLEDADAVSLWRALHGEELPPRRCPLLAGPLMEAARLGRRAMRRAPFVAEALAMGDLDVDGMGLTAVVAVPMVMSVHLEGMLLAAWCDDPPAGAEGILEALAAHGMLALRNARLYDESQRERRREEALGTAIAALAAASRVGEVQRLILQHARALCKADGAALALVEDRYVQVVAAVGSAAAIAGRLIPLEGSLQGEVVRARLGRIVNDVAAATGVHRAAARAVDLRRVLMAPLVTAHGVLGVVSATDRETPFTDEDLRVLQRLADHGAFAFSNARRIEWLRDAEQDRARTFDALPVAVLVLDKHGAIVRLNARASAVIGPATGRPLLGVGLSEALHGLPTPGVPAPVADALASGEAARGLVVVGDAVFDIQAVPHPAGGVVVTLEVASELRPPEPS